MLFKNIDKNYIEESSKQKKFANVKEHIKNWGNIKENKLVYYSFLVSVLMTVYLCITSIGAELSFLLHTPIYGLYFILFPFIGMVIFTIILKKEREKFYWLVPISTLIAYFMICFILIYFNNKIWDMSSDSLGYHQPMIIALFNGWNPVYNPTFNHSLNIWDIHYPKSNAIYATMIYKITGKIAGAKILSMLIPIISSLWAFSFVASLFGKKKRFTYIGLGVLGAILVLINPINIEQIFTFYVDSSLGGMIIILIMMIFFIIFFKDLKIFKFTALIFIIAFTSNIKFTGLIFCAGILTGLFIFILFYGSKDEIRKMFIFLLANFIFTFAIIGFDPYITNIISNKNPFYPLMGKGAMNIIIANTPADLLGKSNFLQCVQSLFANISNGISSTGIPIQHISQLFTISSKELQYYATPDPRLRALGMLSFIIEPISFVLFLILITQMIRKKINKFFIIMTIIISVIITLLTLQSGGYWWGRYIPVFWILPSMLVIGLISFKNKMMKILGVLFLVLIIINFVLFIPTLKYKKQTSNLFKSMVFADKQEKIVVKGGFGWQVMQDRYKEFNIPYIIQNSKKIN